MDSSSARSDRRSPRKPVLLSATVEVHGAPVPVMLRNLSEQGALIEGVELPQAGTVTWFERGPLRVMGTIIWAESGLAGISFSRALRADEVLRHIPTPPPLREVVHRRPAFTTHTLSAEERRLLAALGAPVGTPRNQ
jgi:hypothetical protein